MQALRATFLFVSVSAGPAYMDGCSTWELEESYSGRNRYHPINNNLKYFAAITKVALSSWRRSLKMVGTGGPLRVDSG
ncbi:20443_t:CDS:1 [Gigaspora margarita]|uniref:20443_t:CDS:1 n=1 Tax=Gigaspora margarita TaxID=4874 RepID=A0ABN7W6L7_GIGMA|nr:20443_t:CDS:1 [Gigaspora margarita]